MMCRKVFMVIGILTIFFISGAYAVPNYFEINKQHFLDTEGSELRYPQEAIWAWLEKLQLGQINGDTHYVLDEADKIQKPVNQVIHNIIRSWGSSWIWDGENYPPYVFAWQWAAWQEHLMMCWICYKYGNVIDPSDVAFIENLFNSNSRSRNIAPGSTNSQIADIVMRYLWCQDNKDIRIEYSTDPPPNININAFEWEGRTYVPGTEYNAYELMRDWLNYRIDLWVSKGYVEFDTPAYTWCFIHGLTTLYEFAKDPLMKRKAKMATDFLLLESVLDFSANQWGGAMGRFYEDNIIKATSSFYWSVFWDMCKPSHEPSYSILISSYRLPDAIVDIGDLSDEPDNYHHVNMEYNINIVKTRDTGKWNYVTKYYTLGGARGGQWQLCIHSDDEPGSYHRPGVPFRMWINSLNVGEDVSYPVDYQAYLAIGEMGYQYKNALFTRTGKLHYAIRTNSFDADETLGNWRFFKEGKTMVAVRTRDDMNVGCMEVAIEGLDYPSFGAFKTAIRDSCDLDRYFFKTSHGDYISYQKFDFTNEYGAVIKKSGESDYDFVWDFPFPRVQTVDHLDNWIVRWDGSIMTVTKHGSQLTYDFDNWIYEESAAPPDQTPPAVVEGVTVTQP